MGCHGNFLSIVAEGGWIVNGLVLLLVQGSKDSLRAEAMDVEAGFLRFGIESWGCNVGMLDK